VQKDYTLLQVLFHLDKNINSILIHSPNKHFICTEFITKDNLLKQLNDYWDYIAPYLLDFYDTVPIDQQKQVAERIRSYYLGSRPINKNTISEIIRMMGDRLFDVDFEKAVRLQANINKSPVWTYYYSYRATYSVSEILSGGSTENFGNFYIL
jgi:hypothetical protein